MQYPGVKYLKMQAAEEIHSAPKVSGSSLSLLPLSFSSLCSAEREAIGRIFPSYFMRTFSEFTPRLNHVPFTSSAGGCPQGRCLCWKGLRKARSKYLPWKRNVWPLKSICTHLLQVYSPATLVSATGGQSCAMETCGTEPWGALPGTQARALSRCLWHTKHPKRKPVPPPLLLIYVSSCFRFFFSQNYLVICCWISSAKDSGAFSQHRLTESQAAPQVPASANTADTDGEAGLATSPTPTWKIFLFWDNSQSLVSQGMAEQLYTSCKLWMRNQDIDSWPKQVRAQI